MKRLALLTAVVASSLLAPLADAVTPPGPNGKIVFTSGRGGAPGNDDNAKIWIVNSDAGGTATQLTTGTTRHSHPAWSPDRTKVAYSRSRSGAGSRDIYVRDLVTGIELQLTNTVAEDEDRAAWSPDGTEIAYGVAATDAFGAPRDILIRPSTGGAPRNLAVSSVASEDKPVWSPDGQLIYYARNTEPPTNSDIVKELADNTGAVVEVVNTADNDYQPNLSHDGAKICFSRGGMGDSGATGVDVFTADANALNSNVDGFATSTTKGEFNCVFSPDDTRILHVRGVFTGGELVVNDFPPSGQPQVVSDVAQHFDGNPDWAIDPSPSCSDTTVNVAVNGIAEIPLSCVDEEGQGVSREIATQPGNGVLSSITSDDRVFYTPNVNFEGTDQFTFKGSDGTSDSAPATVTVNVKPATGPAAVASVIGKVKLSRKKWRRGKALPRFSRTGKGTKISFTLSKAARVTMMFSRAAPGRRVRGKCRKPTGGNRSAKRCRRYVKVGKLSFAGKRGANTVGFAGRLNAKRRLPLGAFKVTVNAQDTAGRAAKPRSATFRIVAR
jgi:Tol biopolymer transport system component